MSGVTVSPSYKVLVHDRPWVVRQVSRVADFQLFLELEALDGDAPARLSVSGSGPDSPAAVTDAWPAPWLSNPAVAETYGLTPKDSEHIFSTFPVSARKRPAFYKFLEKEVGEWKAETPRAPRRGYTLGEAKKTDYPLVAQRRRGYDAHGQPTEDDQAQ